VRYPVSWSVVFGDIHLIFLQPSPLRWIWSLYSNFVGGSVPQDCQIYAQSLMSNGVGFPLWFPEPGGCLPMGYRMKGVSIGDVGLITPDGAFDYLFNICLPLDDPANINRVPENFLPLEPWDPSDVHKIAFAYPPGGHVASGSIERLGFVLRYSVDHADQSFGPEASQSISDTNTHSNASHHRVPYSRSQMVHLGRTCET